MHRIDIIKSYVPLFWSMVLAIALSSFSSLASAQSASPARQQAGASDPFERGMHEFENANYKAAIELFTRAIALKPNNARAYFQRGLANDSSWYYGKEASALDDYNAAIKLNPRYAEAYCQRALHQSELKQKLADFDLAIQANPRYAPAFYQRGVALMDEPHFWLKRVRDIALNLFPSVNYGQKEYLEALQARTPAIRQAIENFSRAIEIQPDFGDAYSERGRAYDELREYKSAGEDFTQVVRFNPANFEAYYQLGLAHFDQREYQKAIDDLTRALALKPGESTYYSKRGLARFKLGDKERALDDYRTSLRDSPVRLPIDYVKRLHANPKIADAQYATIEDFLPEILDGVQDKEKVAAVYYERGMTSHYQWRVWRSEETEATAQSFTEAIQRKPDYADAYYQRGLVRFEQKQDASAIGDFTQAIQLDSRNGSLYYSRGLAYYRLRNWTAAARDFTSALQFSPEIRNAFYQRGLAYYEAGDDSKAIQDFLRSAKDEPDTPDAYYHLGLAYERSGEKEKAIGSFLQAVKLISPAEVEPNLTSRLVDTNLATIYCRGLARLELALRNDVNLNPFSRKGPDEELMRKSFLEQSENDFTAVIRSQPGLAEAYYQRGRARLARRLTKLSTGSAQYGEDVAGALADFGEAIRLKSNLAKVYLARGQYYGGSLKPALAIKEFSRAIQFEPNNAAAYYALGEIYLENYEERPKDLNAALASFTKVIGIDPGFIRAYFNRAYIREEQHNPRGAIENYAEIIRRDPENAAGYRGRGRRRLELKDFSGAIEDLNRAIELEPSEPGSDDYIVAYTYVSRGLARYNLGDGRGANQDYQMALLIRPCLNCMSGSTSVSPANKAEAFLHRGLSFLRRGDKKASRENLEQAARLFYAQGNMTQYQNVKYQLSKF